MAQADVAHRPSVAYFGTEGVAFGTLAASMIRATPVAESMDISGLMKTQIDVPDMRALGLDYVPHVHGFKSKSAIKWAQHFRPHSSILNAAGSAADNYQSVVLKALLGSETRAAGSDVVSGASATVFDVTGGHGSRFSIGQWISVNGEATQIVNIATDTLTVSPALSGTPVATNDVCNAHSFVVSETNTGSLSAQFASAIDSNLQWQALGVTGNLGIELPRNGIPRFTVDARCATWTGPSAQSFTITHAAESMGTPFAVVSATTLVQSTSATTRTQYALHSAAIQLQLGNTDVDELGGTTEGVTSLMRVPTSPCATITLRHRIDRSLDTTDWETLTAKRIAIIVPQGSGASTRFLIIDAPTCLPFGKPKAMNDGGRWVHESVWRADLNAVTGSTATDLARSPFGIHII